MFRLGSHHLSPEERTADRSEGPCRGQLRTRHSNAGSSPGSPGTDALRVGSGKWEETPPPRGAAPQAEGRGGRGIGRRRPVRRARRRAGLSLQLAQTRLSGLWTLWRSPDCGQGERWRRCERDGGATSHRDSAALPRPGSESKAT